MSGFASLNCSAVLDVDVTPDLQESHVILSDFVFPGSRLFMVGFFLGLVLIEVTVELLIQGDRSSLRNVDITSHPQGERQFVLFRLLVSLLFLFRVWC
jgi:hypothetical protein